MNSHCSRERVVRRRGGGPLTVAERQGDDRRRDGEKDGGG